MISICCEEGYSRNEAVEVVFAMSGIVEFLFMLGVLACLLSAWRTSCGEWQAKDPRKSTS